MKWYGNIAFSNVTEVSPGIWEDNPEVRTYYGEFNKVSKRDQLSDKINSDLTISNTLSVVADPYLLNSFQNILYVEFLGAKWRVSQVDVGYPRLTMTFGDLYNDEVTESGN